MSDQPDGGAWLNILLILSVLAMFAASVNSGSFSELLGLGVMFLFWVGYKYGGN